MWRGGLWAPEVVLRGWTAVDEGEAGVKTVENKPERSCGRRRRARSPVPHPPTHCAMQRTGRSETRNNSRPAEARTMQRDGLPPDTGAVPRSGSGNAYPPAHGLGICHGNGDVVPFGNRILKWGVVIATFLSVLSSVPRPCAIWTDFLRPKCDLLPFRAVFGLKTSPTAGRLKWP